jgi:ribosomal protein L2
MDEERRLAEHLQKAGELLKGGQLARTAGSSAQVVAKEGEYASVKMPSTDR